MSDTLIKPTSRNSARSSNAFSVREGEQLAAKIRQRIRGDVRFDAGSRAAYSRDASNYRQIPIGVIVPKDADDVQNAVEICQQAGVPILGRGGGTSLAGQCCNVAVVFDFSRYMNRVLEINPEEKWARVQPGLVLDDLQAAAKPYDLCFGPNPSTHDHCTLGGMIGNNSCGTHSIIAGRTVDNVYELEVLLYDGTRLALGPTSDDEFTRIVQQGGRRGEIYAELKRIRDHYADAVREKFPDIPRRVSGYCLDELLPEKGFQVARSLVGTESTCVLILEARVRLIHSPPYRTLAVACYPDIYEGADHVPEILKTNPMALEALDDRLIHDMHLKGMKEEDLSHFPQGYGGWLVLEYGGDTQAEANQKAKDARESLEKERDLLNIQIYEDPEIQQMMWHVRESGLGATAFVPTKHDSWPGWEDSAVHRDNLGAYLRDLRHLLEEHGYECSFYGHFGDGLIHTRIDFELRTRGGLDNYRSFIYAAADLVNQYGGSYSGEHGDGQARGELLSKLYGDDLLQAFREFKRVWDPDWRMNPGKVVDANPMDANLSLGTDYRPLPVTTHFSFHEEGGDFHHATRRCVGVGECRREEGGTMCPSYMVTRDETQTTRGRARLLFEMLEGDIITDGWQSEEVKDALDLCLACKGCKGDCPVQVDMATYKAEFLSHYYERKWRPRSAWAMGWIDVWARLASYAPRLVNTIAQSPIFGPVAKWMGGISQERQMPAFAAENFVEWFQNRKAKNAGAMQVMLWPDTFNNHFTPETSRAAVEVLEHAGFHVTIPKRPLCCGRPLYDYGFLDRAKAYLLKILDVLSPEIEAGVPIVVLEPSCLAVFRDELRNLLPQDENARRLAAQSYSLAEFIKQYRDDFEFPQLKRRALVHHHCHHKSVIGTEADEELLKELGIDFELPDSGCCGMAGSFGFEEQHLEVSRACGERVLLPEVRNIEEDAVVMTDGFSCSHQIEAFTNRQSLHLAQVLQMALHESQSPSTPLPEKRYRESHRTEKLQTSDLVVGAAAACIGWLVGGRIVRELRGR